MGNNSTVKQMRSQIRQVVKDILPEVLNAELMAALEKRMLSKVDGIAANVKETLHKIDERSKDVQSYMVRQATLTPPVETKKE